MVVYLITCFNGKRYCGITSSPNPRRRWYSHVCHAKRGEGATIGAAIRKYGAANFDFEPIMDAEDLETALKLERLTILSLDLTNKKKGYNRATEGTLLPEDSKEAQREKLRGNKNAAGKRSPEFNQSMSDRKRQCKGYVFTSPTNQTYFATNLSEFCRNHGLSKSNANRAASGKGNTVKGWRVKKVM